MKLRCPKCDKETVDAADWWLDRWLKVQNKLTANKVKYSKTEYTRKYKKTQRYIESLDPWFKTVKD